MTASDERAARLDELNTESIRRQSRNITDRGLDPRDPDSALFVGPTRDPSSPLCRGLLQELRDNAEAVYGDPPRRAPKTS